MAVEITEEVYKQGITHPWDFGCYTSIEEAEQQTRDKECNVFKYYDEQCEVHWYRIGE